MINTCKSEKHIIKELHFGTGDIHCGSVWTDDFKGLGFYQIEKGEIGRLIEPQHDKNVFFNEELQVLMTFSNIESLDVTIKNLEMIRDKFLQEEEFICKK